MLTLHVQLLGEFHVTYADIPHASIHQARQRSLFAYLLLHRHAPQTRQQLAFLLWPDSAEAQARANLRRALHDLRHGLPDAEHFFQLEADTVQWRADAPLTLDVAEFEHQLRQADEAARNAQYPLLRAALEAAVALYRGDLLNACYDEWILPERERLREQFLKTLERLILVLEDQGNYGLAIEYAQQLLRCDPLHETTYGHLMRLQVLHGERARALRTYHTCVTVLQRELGIEPHPTTQEAYARLLDMAPRGEPGPPAPLQGLVSRQPEWEKLQASWRSAIRGHAHFVLISGEAGIGKTRLAEELSHWASQQGVTVARTRSYAAEGDLAYTPVIEWLRSEALQAVLPRLEAVWLTEIARLLPELLAQHGALPRPEPLSARWQRQRLFEALARAILLGKPPLLLMIDDLQWCDRETLEWLHYLLRFDPKARLLVIGAVRPEEVDEQHPLTTLLLHLRRAAQLTEFELGPLNVHETARLVTQVAERPLEAVEMQSLYQATAGNPLFVVEMVRARTARQRFEIAYSEVTSKTQYPVSNTQSLPPKVHAVIQARLNQLSPPARALASLAAVIGRAFTFEVLAQTSGSDEEMVVRGLDELWQRRIVREQGVNAYDFCHDRIREVTYAGLSPIRRRTLHGRVAATLKRLYANDLDAVSAVLAVHYEQAGLPEQALLWYQRAAEADARRFAYASAIDYLNASLTLLKTLPPMSARINQELAMLLAQASNLVAVQGFTAPDVANLYTRVEAILNQIDDDRLQFRAHQMLRQFYGAAGKMGQAHSHAKQLLRLALGLEDPALLVDAYQAYGIVSLQLGQFPLAKQHFVQAETLYRGESSNILMMESSYNAGPPTLADLALTMWLLGYPDQAQAKLAEALILAEKVANPFQTNIVLFLTTLLYRHMHEVKLIAASAERMLALDAQYGMLMARLEGIALQGWLQIKQGNFKAGIAQIRTCIDEYKQLNHTMFQTHRLGLLIEAQLKAGQLAAGAATLDEAFAMSAHSGQRSWDAELYRLKGELLYAMGASEAEVTLAYERAIQIAHQQSAKTLELRATMSLSQWLARQGRQAEARQLLAEMYAWFSEGFDTVDLKTAKTLLDELTA